MEESVALARIDAVRDAIERADLETLSKAIRLLDAANKYAKAKKWTGLARQTDVWALEARREAGKILSTMEKNPGTRMDGAEPGRGGDVGGSILAPPTSIPRLQDLGITKKESYFWQALGRIPESKWDEFKVEAEAGMMEAAVSIALRYAAERPIAETPPPPTGKYRCIVIDPPWETSRLVREMYSPGDKGGNMDYATLPIDEIEKKVPIHDIAAEDGCHVYLWVTHKHLPDGLTLFDKWGIKYQCLLTWVKPEGMVPYSWMYNTEHVLFGRIGSLKLLQDGVKLSFASDQRGIAGKHSAKPSVFYDIVRKVSPPPRIDMFAREAHDGFDSWGSEAK